MSQSLQDAVRMMQRVSEPSLAMSHIVCSASRQTWTRPKLPLKTAAADKRCRLPKHCCLRLQPMRQQSNMWRISFRPFSFTAVHHWSRVSAMILTLNSKIWIYMNFKLKMHFFSFLSHLSLKYGRRLVPRVKMLFKSLVAAFNWLWIYSWFFLKINSFMRRTARTVETVFKPADGQNTLKIWMSKQFHLNQNQLFWLISGSHLKVCQNILQVEKRLQWHYKVVGGAEGRHSGCVCVRVRARTRGSEAS